LPHPSSAASPPDLLAEPLPAVWWRGLSFGTATWIAIRRTAATTASRNHHIINRWMNMSDATMLGRGQCRQGNAEDNCSQERNSCLAQHFVSPLSLALYSKWADRTGEHRTRLKNSIVKLN
jgi:hypothetical protein